MERVDYESMVIQDISNAYKADELMLNPWYQRRSVWNPAQKGYLLNTLFVKKPIPTIYIRHYLDIEKEKSIKEVVDGQQRMRAILGYLEDDFTARHPEYKQPVKYSDLTPQQKTTLKMTKVPTGILVDADESDVIEIFGRLNSISKTLNAQEKRNAKFSGAFKQFSLETAAGQVKFWRNKGIFSATEISRMAEVQFVSDLIFNMVNGISDFSAAKVDSIYKKYDDAFPLEADIKRRVARIFKGLEAMSDSTLKDTIFSRSPIFFSLFLVLNKMEVVKSGPLQKAMLEIDAVFSTPTVQNEKDKAFVLACTASTQRIKSRQIRDDYLTRRLA